VNASANLNSNEAGESNHVEDDRTFSNGIGLYVDAAKQRVNDVAQRVSSTVSDVYASVSQRVQNGTEVVQPTINDTVSTVKSTVGDISQRANSTVSNLTNQASSTASNTAASAKSMAGHGDTAGLPDREELKQANNKLPKQNEISYGSAYANSKSMTNNIAQERTESRTVADVHDSKPNITLNPTNATMSPTRTKQHYTRDSDKQDDRSGSTNPSADIKTGDREGEQTNHGVTNNVIARTKQSPPISTNHKQNQQEMSSHKQTEEGPPKNKQNLPNSMVLKSAL